MTTKPLLTKASIGKRYVRRDGFLSEPLNCVLKKFGPYYTHRETHPLACATWSYTADGIISDIGEIDDCDLVRLATPAEIRAGKALEVKGRKAKEGRDHSLWCFEYFGHPMHDGLRQLFRVTTRCAARRNRWEMLGDSYQCGPIFKVTITCPAWSPK